MAVMMPVPSSALPVNTATRPSGAMRIHASRSGATVGGPLLPSPPARLRPRGGCQREGDQQSARRASRNATGPRDRLRGIHNPAAARDRGLAHGMRAWVAHRHSEGAMAERIPKSNTILGLRKRYGEPGR